MSAPQVTNGHVGYYQPLEEWQAADATLTKAKLSPRSLRL